MADDAAKRAWVKQVLGFTITAGAPDPALSRRWLAMRSAWQAASEQVDAEIAALAKALRGGGAAGGYGAGRVMSFQSNA